MDRRRLDQTNRVFFFRAATLVTNGAAMVGGRETINYILAALFAMCSSCCSSSYRWVVIAFPVGPLLVVALAFLLPRRC